MIPLDFLGFLHLTIVDVLDIVVVAFIIYLVFRWLKGSSAMNILIAIVALFLIRFLSEALGMKLLSALMGAVINVGAIALIVIFQPEIRQFLNRVGRSTGIREKVRRRNWLDRLLGRKDNTLSSPAIKELMVACRNMAENKTGALIVLLHKDALRDVIDSGERMDAEINSSLIENIFFKNSPLHDGAMLIDNNRIIAVRCTLPISKSNNLPAKYGMRHKAAIGISERSDAEVIVISEQRGTISFVRDGIISQIDNIGELKLKLEPPKPQEDL
jgi:diadenylate cyclase